VRRSLPAVVAGVLALGALAGCSHPRSSKVDTPTPSTTASAPTGSSSAYLDTPTPSTATTTQPGTQLALKATATVQWTPKAGLTGLVDLAVDQVQRSSFSDKVWRGWNVPKQTRQSTPYFVHATVKNLGTSSLDGAAAPFYLLDDAHQLLQASSFKTAFTPCTPPTLPPHFGPGQSAQVCLVYLVPKGKSYVSVAYRPDDAQEPITWAATSPGSGHS
jgi:hypothetical protein